MESAITLSMRVLSGLLLLVTAAGASPDIVRRAGHLYRRADYTDSPHVFAEDPAPDAAGYLPTANNYYMSGELLFAQAENPPRQEAEQLLRRPGGSTE